ncbi:MAG: glycosyltransferase family A protein, partial [Anaerolineaceae bacterium]
MNAVSVVIPVYNCERFLAETLNAVAAQSRPAAEIIVVDDESTDGSVRVALESGIPLRLIRRPNSGVSHARNVGLAAAEGDFVCFLDQDDIWHPAHLARQIACFETRPEAGVVFSRFQHWYPEHGDHPSPSSLWAIDSDDAIDPEFSGWIYHQFLRDCWALTSLAAKIGPNFNWEGEV